jgi:hypothetical protein
MAKSSATLDEASLMLGFQPSLALSRSGSEEGMTAIRCPGDLFNAWSRCITWMIEKL